jgi:hypothetical protein
MARARRRYIPGFIWASEPKPGMSSRGLKGIRVRVPYKDFFGAEKDDIGPQNTYFGIVNPE